MLPFVLTEDGPLGSEATAFSTGGFLIMLPDPGGLPRRFLGFSNTSALSSLVRFLPLTVVLWFFSVMSELTPSLGSITLKPRALSTPTASWLVDSFASLTSVEFPP